LQIKQLNGELKPLEDEIFSLMLNLDIQAIEVDDKKIYRIVKEFPKITDEPKFFDWLRFMRILVWG
jgi:hypothetical protein